MAGTCGFEKTDIKTGKIIDLKSPNRPYYYPPNFQCTWRISSANQVGSFAIQFLVFGIQFDTDVFTIGTRNRIESKSFDFIVSAWMPPNVIAVIEEEELWTEFKSDWAKSGPGFELLIKRIKETGTRKVFYNTITDKVFLLHRGPKFVKTLIIHQCAPLRDTFPHFLSN